MSSPFPGLCVEHTTQREVMRSDEASYDIRIDHEFPLSVHDECGCKRSMIL
jgi:hypothetical protein